MSAIDGKCDRCHGSGLVMLPLFFSIVDEKCPTCSGSGKHIYMCPLCKTNKATITEDLQGNEHVNMCNTCASQAGTASNVAQATTNRVNYTTITYKILI